MEEEKKFLNYDGLLYYNEKVKANLNKKVDKVEGKGLSTNDYTNEEKSKLKNLKNYELPIASSTNLGGVKVGTGLTIDASTGILSATAIEVPIDSDMSSTSTNPVQNKIITAALEKKVDKIAGKGLSTNDYTNEEKTKLAGIETGANKTIVDTTLSSDSINPVQNKIVTSEFNKKVDKVDGKDLSTNDYTTADKNKLSGIENNAEVNIIENIKVNEVNLAVSNKTVNITVPTNNNQLTNGAGYQNSSQVAEAISNALSGITSIDFRVLSSGEYNGETLMPTIEGEKGIIYLVPKSVVETNNTYVEWIYTNNTFEKIGDTQVDLTDYVKYSDIVEISNAEIDTMWSV